MWKKNDQAEQGTILYYWEKDSPAFVPPVVLSAGFSIKEYNPLVRDPNTLPFMAKTLPARLSTTLSLEDTRYRLSLELYHPNSFMRSSLEARVEIVLKAFDDDRDYSMDSLPPDTDRSLRANELRSVLQLTKEVQQAKFVRFTSCQRIKPGLKESDPHRAIEPAERELVLPYLEKLLACLDGIELEQPPFQSPKFYPDLIRRAY